MALQGCELLGEKPGEWLRGGRPAFLTPHLDDFFAQGQRRRVQEHHPDMDHGDWRLWICTQP